MALNKDEDKSTSDSSSNNTLTSEEKSNAQRKLNFGGESGKNLEDVKMMYKEDLQKSSEKWNFDFKNEVPLPGDWKWVKVADTDVEVEKETENEENRNV